MSNLKIGQSVPRASTDEGDIFNKNLLNLYVQIMLLMIKSKVPKSKYNDLIIRTQKIHVSSCCQDGQVVISLFSLLMGPFIKVPVLKSLENQFSFKVKLTWSHFK